MKYILIFSFALFSCSESKLPESSDLGGLRVLTLIADNGSGFSEVSPGETVTITPLISHLDGTAAPTYEAWACVDSGVSFGGQPSCEGNSSRVSLARGTVSTLTLADSWTGAANTFSVTVPAEILSQRSTIQAYNGVSYLVEYRLTGADGKVVSSLKRILVSNRPAGEKNRNPTLTLIQSNGQDMTQYPVSDSTQLSIGASQGETYPVYSNEGELVFRQESLLTSWFISDGDLNRIRTLEGEYTTFIGPSNPVSGRKAFVIAVVLDGRGGAAFRILSF